MRMKNGKRPANKKKYFVKPLCPGAFVAKKKSDFSPSPFYHKIHLHHALSFCLHFAA